jgi:hypothetical protein
MEKQARAGVAWLTDAMVAKSVQRNGKPEDDEKMHDVRRNGSLSIRRRGPIELMAGIKNVSQIRLVCKE